MEVHEFLKKNRIDVSRRDKRIFAWIPYFALNEFIALLSRSLLEEGLTTVAKQDYLVFDFQEICDFMGWDINEFL